LGSALKLILNRGEPDAVKFTVFAIDSDMDRLLGMTLPITKSV